MTVAIKKIWGKELLVKSMDWNESHISDSKNTFKPGTTLHYNKNGHYAQVTLQNIIKIYTGLYFLIQFMNDEFLITQNEFLSRLNDTYIASIPITSQDHQQEATKLTSQYSEKLTRPRWLTPLHQ